MSQVFSPTFLPNIVTFGQHLAKLFPNKKGALFMVHSVDTKMITTRNLLKLE